jgi:hypothetical protein
MPKFSTEEKINRNKLNTLAESREKNATKGSVKVIGLQLLFETPQ